MPSTITYSYRVPGINLNKIDQLENCGDEMSSSLGMYVFICIDHPTDWEIFNRLIE